MRDKKNQEEKNENLENNDNSGAGDDAMPEQPAECANCLELEKKYKRALADYQNLMRQNARERQEYVKYAIEGFLHDILPVYDNLKISLKHMDEAAVANGWAEGVKYVVKQFKDALEAQGVQEIEAVGKEFDHNTMEAVEGEGNVVKAELRPGYKLNGKVIVAAKVSVGE